MLLYHFSDITTTNIAGFNLKHNFRILILACEKECYAIYTLVSALFIVDDSTIVALGESRPFFKFFAFLLPACYFQRTGDLPESFQFSLRHTFGTHMIKRHQFTGCREAYPNLTHSLRLLWLTSR